MRRLLALPLLLVALVAAACGTTTAPAAEVNGSAISDADFRDELAVLAEHPSFASAFLGVDPGGDGQSSVTSAFAAQVLTIEVILELVDTEVDERGLEVTQAVLDDTRAGLGPDFAVLLDELPADYQQGFLEWNAQIALLRDDLGSDIGEVTDADVQAFYDENEAQFAQSCLSHVLVETEEQADDVLAEIEGGLDFADAAAEFSIDPSAAQNGGDLGCNAPGTFVPGFEEAAFADAPIGEPFGPVESQFGFHLLLVRERSTATFDEVAEQIRAQLEAQAAAGPQQALATWIDEAVAGADISVSSRYGSWDAAQGAVIAPEGPSSVANLLQL
ncbi:MAG TPA: peptidylprolyl isomerase [Acidimicrobiales bacterium]|nr:peptidylprolyl isomerase [Acidimicrobiales bacterium]